MIMDLQAKMNIAGLALLLSLTVFSILIAGALSKDLAICENESASVNETMLRWFSSFKDLREEIEQKCYFDLFNPDVNLSEIDSNVITIMVANYSYLTYEINGTDAISIVKNRCDVLEHMCSSLLNCNWVDTKSLHVCRCITHDMQFWNVSNLEGENG